ncbi:Receptor-type guanylate cyclase gcy [Seminavis robusta]|uniref:Phosphodiesterase n=1 Tax=Seminavis robusta TaxID=568900 RepID=A0A9N8E4I6_9STRA|nr:Receptor-type guanylate cyclase gcy [Seminavis robusta]|eukprot:Sro650_g181380.1 Receptor-type guanylate cyclase gcy (1180) ;mRNA; f:21907-26952
MSSSPASALSAPPRADPRKELMSLNLSNGDATDFYVGDEAEMSHSATNAASTRSHEDEIKEHSMNIEKTTKRTMLMAALVAIMGAAASTSFMSLAITNERKEKEALFVRRAADLAKGIDDSWRDYEIAALWIHESCRDWRTSNYTRNDFRTLYEYLESSGLDFFLMEWVPNISHAERPAIENAMRDFFEEYPQGDNYRGGFTGNEPVPGEEGKFDQLERSDQPFYFPIHFTEPWQNSGDGTHLDLWSIIYEQPIIQKALERVVPVLTPRFYLLGEGPADGYSVVLYHPGKPLISEHDTPPTDLSNIIIRIPALLTRAATAHGVSMGTYLYDSTITTIDPELPPEFMGGINIEVHSSTVTNETTQLVQEQDNRTLSMIPEIPLADLEVKSNSKLFYQHNFFVGQRTWTVVVVPVDTSYEPGITLVVVSGAMIFVAALLLSIWMIHNMRRSIKMHRILSEAAAEAAIVSNLFPPNVRERMIQDAKNRNNQVGVSRKEDIFLKDGDGQHRLSEKKLSNYLSSEGIFGSKPIAELHPYTTILFADLVGFTAWSSVREPYQVFTLLEILYHSYDNIAARRRVFKVETVGDCYVAVCGLPEGRKDHAIVMARFATDCMYRMHKLVKALETTLGPDTGDLGLRVGLHSGQVTAGVLRGDKGRFQLFGDTMNTASRMESTGLRNKIQVSQETADLLTAAGRGDWLVPRKDLITAKGKGTLQTYFLKILSRSQEEDSEELAKRKAQGSVFLVPQDEGNLRVGDETRMQRLVEWNVEVLSQLIKRIVARRAATDAERKNYIADFGSHGDARMPLDEVVPIIKLPNLDSRAVQKQVDPECIELDSDVVGQLKDLVAKIASMYHSNPFHNFEHASHVCMSVQKMLSRIINPKEIYLKKHQGDYEDESQLASELHDHTFGITSDPLTQFACAFSALIHDLDHGGVPNTVLMKEGSPLVQKYHQKSLAEQNSIDLAWELLADPSYDKLLKTICCDETDFKRFRELVVNSVCATDIMDKELGAARKARWELAFSEEAKEEPKEATVNRKATIVIEHLIQASDVSHTMQHWHIYAKWNERLFLELYKAYKAGRLDKDPSIGWVEGEMGFFDFYIIPLAKKLFKCGVFGVSSDEFLNYASINRKEWEKKGPQMVQKYLKDYEADYGVTPERRLSYDSGGPTEDAWDENSTTASDNE